MKANSTINSKHLSYVIKSFELLRELKITPPEQAKKFQGAIPINTEMKKDDNDTPT